MIRIATAADTKALLAVNRDAFGSDIEPRLVQALLADPTAEPHLSLVAERDGAMLGHLLFTKADLAGAPEGSVQILAPLAVTVAAQGQGIGSALVRDGLARLEARGVLVVLLLGYPDYYARFGFKPAKPQGFEAPYPIAPKNSDAWMALVLGDDPSKLHRGRVGCADALNREEYWVE